ncbi:hypothetical protein BYT27DRAFT_7258755 [Phlegmacium glaucopus]|nr:hypothetical protein BYT27DRAFT_7258755 [Phlegmacium glaucopus]
MLRYSVLRYSNIQIGSGCFEQIFVLESALTAAGTEYVKPCEYTFDDKSPYDFVDLSEALETVGTSVYTGAIQWYI